MNFLYKLLYRDPLKRKIHEIKSQMKTLLSSYVNETFSITVLDSVDIDPSYLSFWVRVQTDDEKFRLKNLPDLEKNLRSILETCNYPMEAIDRITISFESQETVDRESNGSWFNHLR